jgi:molybdate transport system regulatory protein
MRRGVAVIGEREARLLEAVERVKSIKDAAGEAGISYRTAWSAIQQMEQALGRPVVVSRAGGPGGGATTLTDECRQLLATYQELRRKLDEDLGRVWETAEVEAAN